MYSTVKVLNAALLGKQIKWWAVLTGLCSLSVSSLFLGLTAAMISSVSSHSQLNWRSFLTIISVLKHMWSALVLKCLSCHYFWMMCLWLTIVLGILCHWCFPSPLCLNLPLRDLPEEWKGAAGHCEQELWPPSRSYCQVFCDSIRSLLPNLHFSSVLLGSLSFGFKQEA